MKTTWSRTYAALLAMVLVSILAPCAFAQGVSVDGDAASDFIVVQIQGDGSLNWDVLGSSGGFAPHAAVAGFGQNGDHLIPANWKSLGETSLGYVRLDQNTNTVFWIVRNEDGSTQRLALGNKNSVLISGADFNGNGYADAAHVVRRKPRSKTAKWSIRTDLFADGQPGTNVESMTRNFGKWAGLMTYLNPFGENDWIGVMAKSKGRYMLTLRNPMGQGRIKVRLGKALGGAQPQPLQQADGTDLILLARRVGTGTQVKIVDLSGNTVAERTLPATGDLIIGNFDGNPGEEVAVHDGAALHVFNWQTGSVAKLGVPAGVQVDAVNINSFRGKSSSKSSSNNGNNGNNGGAPAGGLNKVCRSIAGVAGGVLWKPSADAAGSRFGKIVALFTGGNKPGKRILRLFGKNGVVVGLLSFKPSSIPNVNNGADHFFSGWPGGSGHTASGLASAARKASGSPLIYMEGRGSKCHGPINPTSREGGI